MRQLNVELKSHSLNDRHFCFVESVNLRKSLIHDAVMVFATAINSLGREQVLPTRILCDDPLSSWNRGSTIVNFMKKVSETDI